MLNNVNVKSKDKMHSEKVSPLAILSVIAVLLLSVTGSDIHNALKSKTYQMGRYPKPFHKSLQQQRPFQHVVLFKNSAGAKNTKVTIHKRTFTPIMQHQIRATSDPMDWNRRKYLVSPLHHSENKKSKIINDTNTHFESSKVPKVNKRLDTRKSFVISAAKTEKASKKSGIRNETHKIPLVKLNVSEITGKRKDEIVGKYYYEPIDNDYFPFGDNKRTFLSVGDKQSKIAALPKEGNKNFQQDKIIQGANNKEIVYSNNQLDESKPMELYLTENNGEVKIADGSATQKILEHQHYNQQLEDYVANLRQKKFQEKDRKEYVNEVLGAQGENEERARAADTGYNPSQPEGVVHFADPNGQDQRNNPVQSVPFQPDVDHHEDAINHEKMQEPPLHEIHKVPLQEQGLNEGDNKYNDGRPEELTYRQNWANQESQHSDQENHDPVLSEKIHNFHRLMDKLHRAVLTGRKEEPQEISHRDKGEWQQNQALLHPEEERYNQGNVPPDNDNNHLNGRKEESEQANMEERERERAVMEHENVGMQQEVGGPASQETGQRYQTAFKLTKAIINSAREVDSPSYPGFDINVNGQNLIPEVFEAFSKTNNDLKQRYDALQRWALNTASQAPEGDLRQQIRNLNELSDMVRLVNNLEKDMLKTILKRRKKIRDDQLGYKHEVIPDGKDNFKNPHQRFHNPNDVQDLLQYIYDTYIENRTADEIPVVLQAFQKSVTDIVARKNMTKTIDAKMGNVRNITRDSALISKSIEMLNKEGSEEKNTEIPYSLDDDPTGDYDYEDKTSRQGFFLDHNKDESQDLSLRAEKSDRKLNKFLDRRNEMNSPLITVKLLKALDLFLDSIEIGRKIKRFRSKVEQAANAANGSVVLTSSMRHSLGELNKEINETLSKSVHFSKGKHQDKHDETERQPMVAYGPIATTPQNCTNNPTSVYDTPCRKSPDDGDNDEEKPKPNFKLSEEYNGHPYNANGIYFDQHKEDGKDLVMEKEWYNHTFNPLNDTQHLSLSNFTPTVNDSIGPVVYMDSPHSPYQHIHDLNEEEHHHDYTQSSWNPGNITKLNKEALKGQEYYNKSIPYDKLFANDSYHSWNPANMTELNKEAVKGDKYYHDQYVNESNNFDQEVQKIIDSAITEAKNVSEIDKYYYKHETDTNDHFEKESPVEKNIYPTVVMNSLDNALDKGDKHVNKALDNHNIDKETVNITNKYLDQEDRYINNMFYEENNVSSGSFRNNGSNTQQKSYFHGDINSDKKDQTPAKNSSTLKSAYDNKPFQFKESEGMIQGDWDKRDMDFHQKANNTKLDDSDVSQIENLRKLVKHLQDQNTGAENLSSNETAMLNTTIKQENETTPQKTEVKDSVEATKTGVGAAGAAIVEPAINKDVLMNFYDQSHINDKKNVLQLKQNTSSDDTNKSDEGYDYIKEQEASREEQQKNVPAEPYSAISKTVESFDKSNFKELEQAINEIKKSKKSLSLVHEVVNDEKTNHHVEPEQDRNGDKRSMKAKEDYKKAHEMIQEINEISYVDDDDEPAYHRSAVPGKRHSKKAKIGRRKRNPKHHKHKAVVQKRSVDSIKKRSRIGKGFKMMLNNKKYKRHHVHYRYHKTKRARKKAKISKGTKKNEIEGKTVQKSFLDKLTKSQQKLVWHILKRAYIKKKDNITRASQPEIIAGNATDLNFQGNKSDESLDAILKTFLSDNPDNLGAMKINKTETLEGDTKSNVNASSSSVLSRDSKTESKNPYSTIEETHGPKDFSSTHGYPALTNPQGLPIHPHDVHGIQVGRLVPNEDNPTAQDGQNITRQNINHEISNNYSENGTVESYEEGNKEQFFFKDGPSQLKKDRKFKQKSNWKTSENETEVSDDESSPVSHNLPVIMNHLDKVASHNGNTTVPMSEQKETITNELPVEADESNIVGCRSQNTVITDGDDIFNLPAEKCLNQKQKNPVETTKHNEGKKTSLNNCTQNFITIKKNGFDYKIPTLKCTKINKTEQLTGEVLHVTDFLAGNYTTPEQETTAAGFAQQVNKPDCDPIYKTVVDGDTAYKINVGCKKNVEQVFNAAKNLDGKKVILKNDTKPANKTVDVIRISTPVQNEKVIYKGKNLMMTQDEKGSEKIVIKGPNKTIEISYPPEDDINGFITLKQGRRLYKIPYKNHTDIDAPETLLGKSAVSWLPDYLRSETNNTETFKVRDTAITKETHKNGAKVIKMEKEKASLSIYYPPKNSSFRYNDSGYMVLQENGKTYNIPLDGSKTLKTIVNKTHFNTKAFNMERLQQQQRIQKQSTQQENIPELEYLEHTSPMNISTANTTFAVPATVKQVDLFNGQEGQSTMKLTTGDVLNNIHLVVPVDAGHLTSTGDSGGPATTVNEPNRELTNIKERRFREENFRYRPKAYKADKFRHQKHLIEDPGMRYRNEDEREDGVQFPPRLPPLGFGRIGEPNTHHLEDFPTIANRGVDLQEFAARPQEDDDERHGGNMHDDNRRDDDSREDERHEDDRHNEDDDDKEFHHESRPDEDEHDGDHGEREGDHEEGHAHEGDGEHEQESDGEHEHEHEDDHEHGHEDEYGHGHEDEHEHDEDHHDDEHHGHDEEEEFMHNHARMDDDENERRLVDEDEGERRPPDTEREPEDDPLHGDDQRFFPLKESFANGGGDTEKPVPSLIIPPQLVAGGTNLQNNLLSPFAPSNPANEGGSVFVTGTKVGDSENVRVTPVASSLNPDINDRERLRDFSTYAIGRSIKSSKKKTHGIDPKKMNQFVNQIIKDTRSKSVVPDVRQFPYYAKLPGSALKQLGHAFNSLQRNAIHHYMRANTDKLDRNDKKDLKRLGYTDAELSHVNKQVIGKKRSPNAIENNVGIVVNGKKMGNVHLIPHFQ